MWFQKLIPVVFFVLCLSTYSQGNSDKIVNGTDAREGEIPYIISLRLRMIHMCGGSIIAPQWVLTAAHCIDQIKVTDLSVLYGTIHLHKKQEVPGHTMPVKSMLQHEDYCCCKDQRNPNDIALLELQDRLLFNDNVKPIALPKRYQPTPVDSNALVAGWGHPYTNGSLMSILQKVNLVVISDKYCTCTFLEINAAKQFCGGASGGGRSVCVYDSGGPLVVDGILFGITSMVQLPCGSVDVSSLFTRVAAYIGWISQHINTQ